MASIKELKKEVDNSFEELGFLCHVAMAALNDAARADEIANLYSETVDKVGVVMHRVGHRDRKMKGKEVKLFFKEIRAELNEIFSQRIDQVASMVPTVGDAAK